LNQLEIEVVNTYRHALSNSVLKILFRHSAHIFLCGAAEAGIVSTSFLAMASAQTSAQDELRHLITAAVVRICRRIHYSYMRQLWDASFYDCFLEKDHIVEEIYRKVCISIYYTISIYSAYLCIFNSTDYYAAAIISATPNGASPFGNDCSSFET
jgi:hypothetical protein